MYGSCIINVKGDLISYTDKVFIKIIKQINQKTISQTLKGKNILIEYKNNMFITNACISKKFIHIIGLPNEKINAIRHDIKNKLNPISGVIQLKTPNLAINLIKELSEFLDIYLNCNSIFSIHQ